MAYCRLATDSDVYVWTDGDYFHVWISTSEIDESSEFPEYPYHLQCATLSSLQFLLTTIRKAGMKVPEKAFERIRAELAGDE